MEGITGSILLLCLISLTNANTSPEIQLSVYTVCEDTPIGALAFTIEASDAEDDPLTYTLTGPNTIFFQVDASNGNVTVKRTLDRETDAFGVMKLGVTVSDGPNNTPRNLTIIVSDANDNKPIFQKASYDTEILENTTLDTVLFRVLATDLDTSTAGFVKYSIDEVTPGAGSNLFNISDTTGDVILIGRLNYTGLSTFYRLKIIATDGGGKCYYPETTFLSSTVFSFVTVVDVPDLDPRFIGLPYTGSVEESSPVDTTVLTVTAIDQDFGVDDNIIYSIEYSNNADGLFKISGNGVISVLSTIDREVIGDTVTLTVKATESEPNIHGVRASANATVQINIIDINDNKPEFYKCGGSGNDLSCELASTFTGEVLEHSLGSIPINMTVKDLDRRPRIALTLDGPDKDVFSVEPRFTMSDSIVQLLVKQPQQLDYENTEKQQMVLQVIAVDEEDTKFHSTATVTIQIKDINDNSPKFPQDTYKLKVAEHSPVGTILANITAEDPDTMDQGNITYRLLPDSILQYFDVEPRTGTVYVKNKTLLDREVRSLYSATLEARDTDNKPGTTVLEITVTDINDQHPVFNRGSYLEFVEEGGELDLKIEATDDDDTDTVNSKIVFAIMPSKYSNNFTIDAKTGVLRNRGELDREALDPELKGRIELNITATDQGTPRLSAMVKVIINVQDVNDNTPEFEAPSYKFFVKEGEKGAFVGSVHAADLDQTAELNRISFSIISGSFGSFIIRTFVEERGYRGNISVDPDIELDYESDLNRFTLSVEAADLEQKKAEVKVEVNVLDVNDERPEFKPVAPVTVKENTTISEAVGSFTAQDKDGNHSLIYELESIKCRCSGSLTPCDYFILEPTGEVRLNPKHTLDYELCDQVLVEAQVVDEYTEKGENNSDTAGQMVINIEDINDNTPEFIHTKSVFVVVAETASMGTSVAGVTATDRDSGVNKQIEFEVTAVQFEDTNNYTSNMRILFEAVTTQQKDNYVGIIQTTEGLDLKLKGKFLVTVTATDTGDLSSSTVLEIFTVDGSYKVKLGFTSTQAQVEKDMSAIIMALSAATGAAVEVVAILPGSAEESRAEDGSIIVAYFVYSNGTALTKDEVEKMVSDPDHFLVLGALGLRDIGGSTLEDPEVDPVMYILLGLVGGLVIVLSVLTTSLVCTRRNYRRKLKAAKAMNSASMVASDNQKSGPVVPGTNKYTMEGANPVLNLNFDTAMVLDLDEESSDVDKVSLNSLDYSDDMAMSEKDTKPFMQMIKEEEDNGPPEYIEPLGAALAQRGQKGGSSNAPMVFTNPAFSTTDL